MPIRIIVLWLSLCVLFIYNASAQVQPDSLILPFPATSSFQGISGTCATDLLLNQFRLSKAFIKQEALMNEAIRTAIVRLNNDTIVLPVVFHILSKNPSAITDAVVKAGLADLNDAFAKRGAWSGSKGVDTKIRFCLARVHPDGGNTTGINRVETHWGDHVNPLIEDAKVKATAQWDPQRYINIWLVNSIDLENIAAFECGNWFRLGTAGYATLPPNTGPLDGIVSTGFGLVLAHEMGHYLGLYHTFEGFCTNNNCTNDGDRVCDTPPDGSYRASASCSSPENSCNTDTLSNYSNGNFTQNVPDPIDNIMEYSNAACQNSFTQGQADRMMAAVNTQRAGLLVSKCEVACIDNVYAGFQKDNIAPKIGDIVNFQNTSTGATSYEWRVDGILVSTSKDFQYTFNTAGTTVISLKAIFTANCFSHQTENIIVNCGVVARFYTNKHKIASKAQIFEDSILFTNQSVNATNFQWLMAFGTNATEQVLSTNKDLSYMFANPGNYTFRLIASNGTCADTTNFYRLTVDDPTPDAVLYMNTIHCYEQTKVRVSFFVCNFSYDTIPVKTPVSFYDADPRQPGANKLGASFLLPNPIAGYCCSFLYTHIVEVGAPGLNQIFVVVNDDGSKSPLVFPVTGLEEKNYFNNIQSSANFQFRIQTLPASATMEPGDTLKLLANPYATAAKSFVWSNASRLSCTNCQSPNYIADTSRNTIKRVIGTSIYGCYDTAFVNIVVPPYHDFRMRIDEAECAGTDSIHIKFTLFNDFKRGILPKGLTVRFFDANPTISGAQPLPPNFVLQDTIAVKEFSFTTTIKRRPSGTLFGLVNDTGSTPPIPLPASLFEEKNYNNNLAQFNYQALNVTTTPLTGLIEPGDTVQLNANASPGIINSYIWSPAYNVSCNNCNNPLLYSDTSTTKRVIAENQYRCRDTAFVIVDIPPADDYKATIENAACAANDSMFVQLRLENLFRRGILPKGLTVRFYDGDPFSTTSNQLLPALVLPTNETVRNKVFTTRIKNSTSGKLYIVVNDSGIGLPLSLPNSMLLEKDYSNNVVSMDYSPEVLLIVPQDTTILRGSSFTPIITNTLVNAASTLWQIGSGYTLSCTNCTSPLINVTQPVVIGVQSLNAYGCPLKGKIQVRIFPPDFTLQINETECINNSSTRIRFTICMNNGYDTVWQGIPVSFYEGDPATASSRHLQTVFFTPTFSAGNCSNFTHTITTPNSNSLFGVVNDRGLNNTPGPDIAFGETNTQNNIAEATSYKRFILFFEPADTTIERSSSITLFPIAEGGSISNIRWSASPVLSCINCTNPVLTPLFTNRYLATATNQNQCTDTAWITVRTVTIGDVYIPSGFTPNNDGLNDIFYIMGSERIERIENFIIYSRYGDQIFEAHAFTPNDPAYGWRGFIKNEKAPAGAYVYQVLIRFVDGKKEYKKGTITLIR